MKRFTQSFLPTLREVPKDAEIPSHQLMVRAGMVKKVASGVYNLLPYGLAAVQKVSAIIREELNQAGANEIEMPHILPKELWEKTGRWDLYGDQLLRMSDRMGREFCFGPTHEEVITELVNSFINSYKQLPLNLYQIQTKFRDEIRPRFGLMRSREFIMKDAYSFHATDACLDETYQKMGTAYRNIFSRCGLDFYGVKADSGTIGGDESMEFMVAADSGEDAILICENCGHGANVEAAQCVAPPQIKSDVPNLEKVATPHQKSIQEVSEFLKVSPENCLKTLIFESEEGLLAVVVQGNHEVNEFKVSKYLQTDIRPAEPKRIQSDLGVLPGFVGPHALPAMVRLLVDQSVQVEGGYIAGANEDGQHFRNFSVQRDTNAFEMGDFRNAMAGDACPECDGGVYVEKRGVEVGHIFKLGAKYSESMGATYLNQNGQSATFIMGCYGIGVGRTVAAAIEQSHDDQGIIFPIPLAPHEVVVIPMGSVDVNDPIIKQLEALTDKLNWNPILDDRKERPGIKFKDADLLGFPFQVVIGKSWESEGKLEVKVRASGEKMYLTLDELSTHFEKVVSHG